MLTRFRPRLRAVVTGGLFFLLYVASTLGSYVYFTLARVVVDTPILPVPDEQRESAFTLGTLPTPEPQPGINVLLLGYGGPEHAGGRLTDSLIVVHLDPAEKRVVLVSVPRDLWVVFPDRGQRKINYAFALGGGGLAKEVVSGVSGLPIRAFVAVSFEGFRSAIDELGGVTVEVPVAFDDPWFPVPGRENDPCGKSPEEVAEILATLRGFEIDKQFPCRFERVSFASGPVLMDGETALTFARSRHSAQHGGDFARSERGVALLLGIKERLMRLGAMADAVEFFNRLSFAVETDLDRQTVETLVEEIGDISTYSIRSIQLTTENVLASASREGQYVLVPKMGEGEWGNVRAYIRAQIEVE